MKLKDESIQLLITELVRHILHVHDECGEFLISAHGQEGLFACNTETGQLQWSVKGRQPGMEEDLDAPNLAADDQGNIFVCDVGNGGIQMFSVSDGRYLGCLIKEGDKGLSVPVMICWCRQTSSLVVLDVKCRISKLDLGYDN